MNFPILNLMTSGQHEKIQLLLKDYQASNPDVKDSTNGVSVIFTGDIDIADPSVILDPFFESIHSGSLSQGMNAVVADFSKLDFLNSSGIKAIAKWIMKQASTSQDQKYKIKIQYNNAVTWQATSLPTLKFLVPDIVEID